ncbi:MAG: helix-turn-helix domain-containing protein [Propionibacteriaceae bacterium]|jgi:transcriptional regulator with XRE-family HTH domain|nr:helix-turn-helix domain-containing protein [Propionibacteriaceae bacterium]
MVHQLRERPTLLREVLGEVLRDLRLDKGMTLREVSTKALVSLGYLSEVERGRKEASSEMLSAICEAHGVTLLEVLQLVIERLDARTSLVMRRAA